MTTVEQMLSIKGRQVYSVTPDTSIGEILKVMADKNIGAVPVIEAEELVGIFSERDFVRQTALRGNLELNMPVKELMTKKVCYVHPKQTIQDCMALMTDKRIRHLPVLLADNQLVGIVSIGDVVKNVISHQEFMIEQLEQYIVSSR
jgi:CBS domain-containing protein